MEGNKDDAAKCLKLAEKFIASGNKDKALKFLTKSIKLYPTKKAEGEVLSYLANTDIKKRFFISLSY